MYYIGLVHYPVLNKHGEIVTTSVTNFDLHDLARTSKTYGISGCYIITPNQAQQNMSLYIQNYWQEGKGAAFNPDRKDAFDTLFISPSIEETCLTIQKRHDTKLPPLKVATSARRLSKTISFKDLKQRLPERPTLFLFGTGWGLAPQVIEGVDHVLEPINGPTEYNHLPVRSAVAIILDRLFGL
ncbi:RNA methyltransferase [bacterium]|nr:RNA methyltransferase [bacterium]